MSRKRDTWDEPKGTSPLIALEDQRPERQASQSCDSLEPVREMPGSIYMVPDRLWGFNAPGREDHPGACVFCEATFNRVTMVKGSGSFAPTKEVLWIEPTSTNGLSKATAFEIVPRSFRLRQIALLHFDRRIGELAPEQLSLLQSEIQRVFPTHHPQQS